MNLKIALPNGRTLIAKNISHVESPIGYRALVPTERGRTTGVVVGFSDEAVETENLEFPDRYPVTTLSHIQTVLDISYVYGLTPWSFLFDLLPKVLVWKEERFIKLLREPDGTLDKQSVEILLYVQKKREVKEELLKKRFGRDKVDLLRKKGFLLSFSKWDMPDLDVEIFKLSVSFLEGLERIERFKDKEKKKELLNYLSERLYCTLEELKLEGFRSKDIRDLIRIGVIQKEKEYVYGVKYLPNAVKQERSPLVKGLERSTVIWGCRESLVKRLLGLLELSLQKGKTSILFISSVSNLVSLESTLLNAFGDRVVFVSSRESPKNLVKNWFLASQGTRIVVGTNLVALAPVRDVENVIVFDELEFKLYNGVDIRNFFHTLSKYLGAKFVLFTPCVDTYTYRVVKEKLFDGEALDYPAQVSVVERKPKEAITAEALKFLKDSSKKTLLLINKVGYAYAYCPSCQDLLLCPNCSSILTLTADQKKVFCRCGYSAQALCPIHQVDLQAWGFGIEKVMQEVKSKLKETHHIHYATQPNLSRTYDYTVVINADNILSVPFFDSQERYFKYLWTALSISKERLIVQTLQPDFPVIKSIGENNFVDFLDAELEERRKEDLPPFTKIVLARYENGKEGIVSEVKPWCKDLRLAKRKNLTEIMCKVSNRKLGDVLRVLRKGRPVKISIL